MIAGGEAPAMITLYTFGSHFGLPDGSPFVVKAMILLKMAGLDFVARPGNPLRSPKGKLPYIEDAGETVADTTFIRRHIEKKYGFDFDAGLTAQQRAVGVAVAAMADEHLYFALVHARWADEAGFRSGAAHFFDPLPAPVRAPVRAIMRRRIVQALRGQGLGRHSTGDITLLAARDIDALAVLIGDKEFLFGATPTSADASVFAQLGAIVLPDLPGGLKSEVERHANLVAYCERMRARYFG